MIEDTRVRTTDLQWRSRRDRSKSLLIAFPSEPSLVSLSQQLILLGLEPSECLTRHSRLVKSDGPVADCPVGGKRPSRFVLGAARGPLS